MRKLKVHARLSEQESASRSAGASLSGVLFLELEGDYFPSENWVDYVLPVLGWWMENALRLFQPEQDVRNVFMDGAYTFVMRRASGQDVLTLRLVDASGGVAGDHTVSYSRYLASLRGAARSVLREIREKGLPRGEDVSTLETRLEHVIRLETDLRAHPLP